jgi:UDP-glucose 4-epimerase
LKSRVAITGVAGFIGSNLADRLVREGHSVVGIDNLSYGVREQVPAEVEFHQKDIRDSDLAGLFQGCQAIFHLAAKNCIPDCQRDPVDTVSINVLGTTQVFEAACRAGVPKVIYAESSALYEGSKLLPTPESELYPESFYSLSKMAGYQLAEGFRRDRGLIITALRYFCVYGPRQDYRRTVPPLMSAFLLKLLAGEQPTIYGNGSKRRDFVFVDDVNDFHLQCLNDGRTDNLSVNLGTGTYHSVAEIYEIIRELLGSQIKPRYLPDQPGEAQDTLADITLARSLGWEPRTALLEGIRAMLAYLQEHVL